MARRSHPKGVKCLHPRCVCLTVSGYCSEMCKVAAIEMWDVRCGCEHFMCRSGGDRPHSNKTPEPPSP
jgi:hypothetical protein